MFNATGHGSHPASTSEYGTHNYTVQEVRQGLEQDIASFGSRYTLLRKAYVLLESGDDADVELVRAWFDIYMSIIDEPSYMSLGKQMEELETEILKRWYARR